ncbi:hypothetical protein L810_4589 [Burkholderia sp. AU4i]|nr:hypothetical protein L810_4589 [Burkholderia sp. AU4i]
MFSGEPYPEIDEHAAAVFTDRYAEAFRIGASNVQKFGG